VSSLAEQKRCGIELETTCKYRKLMDLMIKLKIKGCMGSFEQKNGYDPQVP
jgi:hypothetical protein